jgi:hypothetical protein
MYHNACSKVFEFKLFIFFWEIHKYTKPLNFFIVIEDYNEEGEGRGERGICKFNKLNPDLFSGFLQHPGGRRGRVGC